MKCINSSIVKNTLLILSCMSTTVCLAMNAEEEQAIALFRYTNIMNARGFKTPDKFSFKNGVYVNQGRKGKFFLKPIAGTTEFETNEIIDDKAIFRPNSKLDGDNNLQIFTCDKPSSYKSIDLKASQWQHFVDPNSIYTKERSHWNKFGPMAAVVYLEASLPGNTATTLTGTVAHSAIFSTARTIAIKHSLLNYAPDKMDVLQGGIVAALATAAGVFDRSQCAQQLIKNIEASKVGQATIAKLNPRTKNLLISSCRLVRNACIYLIVDAAMRTYGYDVVLKNYKR